MTARDIMTPVYDVTIGDGLPEVGADATIFDVLPLVAEAPEHRVAVRQDNMLLGLIGAPETVKAMARTTGARDDSSVVVIECSPEDYSASLLAHAVEDADAHLVDLLSAPAPDGNHLRVTIRVRMRDPETAIRSLERYGFRVVDAHGISDETPSVLEERLAALQIFLNV